jgi:hypothetical protein
MLSVLRRAHWEQTGIRIPRRSDQQNAEQRTHNVPYDERRQVKVRDPAKKKNGGGGGVNAGSGGGAGRGQ